MSKCDTMKVGETIRLTHRETEETITFQIRLIDEFRHVVRVGTDADERWIITRLPIGRERDDG